MRSSTKLVLAILTILLASTALVAQDVPVRNWTVPPFDASALKGGQIRPLTHTQGQNPAVFVPLGPCRLYDSRPGSGGAGPIGGVGVGGERTHDFVPVGCAPPFTSPAESISEPILAWSINVTVLNTLGPGFLYFYPAGGSPPPVATLNYTGAGGELRNNAAIVIVNATTGAFVIGAGVNGTDYVLDTNGIFLFELEDNTSFLVRSTVDDAAIIGRNTSGAANAVGVRGEITSLTAGNSATAVRGANSSTTAFGIGVYGSQAGSGLGVYGSSVNGIAVRGYNSSDAGATAAVYGTNDSGSSNSAGVLGRANFDDAPVSATPMFSPAGVRGESAGFGVLGIGEFGGVRGSHVDSTGVPTAAGTIGSTFGADPPGASPWSFFGDLGDLGNTAPKYFVEPDPRDPMKIIGYISLEGREAGTYFRGRGRFQNGIAKITVPEDFRIVTDPDGLTVQITPMGGMASFGVLRADLDEIVVQCSRNLEFSYLVQGVRRAYKERTPSRASGAFVPESAGQRLSKHLPEELQRRLIENGTYKADGSVNMETAQRLGWDKIWEKKGATPPERETPE